MKSFRSIALMALVLSPLGAMTAAARSLAEFDSPQDASMDWRIVDDGVMGGLSKGKVSFTKSGTLLFAGTLSLENNGGFSSVRTKTVGFDLSSAEGFALRVKGDGRTYQLRLSTDARYRSGEVSFKADFPTTKGEWREVKVPFRRFVASWRGRTLENKFNPARVRRLGFLLGDKKPGPFQLEVDWIRTYGPAVADSSSDIVETAVADGRFKTLAKALTEAGLVEALQGDGPLTVFAPTDEAFAKLPTDMVKQLLKPSNRERLQLILKHHVVSGGAKLGDVLKAGSVKTLQGDALNVAFKNGAVRVCEAGLVDADIECSNGVIHVIDSVLLPPEPEPKGILQVAGDAGNFTSLLAAIDAAGLASVLEGDGPFTVFAPTDAAVSKLPEETIVSLMTEHRDQLKAVLTYHVVSGRVSAGDALNAGSVKTVNGQSVEFSIRDGAFQVNDATIKTVDLKCSNGVIHVIDTVLLPSGGDEGSQRAKVTEGRKSQPDPMQRIFTAIDRGVPLYNEGKPDACAAIYSACVEDLVNDERIHRDLRSNLSKALESAKNTSDGDARAWLLRHKLDTTLAQLQPNR